MKIYLDLIFLLNFGFDFILLIAVSLLLRRNVPVHRLLLAALIGGLSIFVLFVPINSLQLFLIKIIISILMSLIAFGFRDIRYMLRNLFFLYTASMLLGGGLYFLNVQFSYKQEGLIFYHHGLSINFMFLIIISPIILYTYVKQGLHLKQNYSNYYQVDIIFHKNAILKVNGFLDTGNKLVDPYTHRPIMLVQKKSLKVDTTTCDLLLVPFDTVNGHGLLKCIVASKVNIVGVGERQRVLVGIMEDNIKIDGIDCILNQKLLEG